MERNLRWAVAALVTLAAVAVPTWLCGAVVLPPLLKDGAIRWGLAGVVGLALAALAALWGHSYATGTERDESAAVLSGLKVQATPQRVNTVTASGERSVAIGGDNSGETSTGDHSGSTAP